MDEPGTRERENVKGRGGTITLASDRASATQWCSREGEEGRKSHKEDKTLTTTTIDRLLQRKFRLH